MRWLKDPWAWVLLGALWGPLWWWTYVDIIDPWLRPWESEFPALTTPGFYSPRGLRITAADPEAVIYVRRAHQVHRACTALFRREWRGERVGGFKAVWPLIEHTGSVALEPGVPFVVSAELRVPRDVEPGSTLTYAVRAEGVRCLPGQSLRHEYPPLVIEVNSPRGPP